jgi:hypothetical protein
MRWSVALAVGGACWISLGGTARASGGDAIFPKEAAYVVVGIGAVAVGSSVVFTAVDVTYGVQLKPLPKRVAIAETACSGLQLALLVGTKLGRGAMSKNDYVLAYGLWTAALTTHGVVSIITAPAKKGPTKSARSWAVGAAPSELGRGAQLTLGGVW